MPEHYRAPLPRVVQLPALARPCQPSPKAPNKGEAEFCPHSSRHSGWDSQRTLLSSPAAFCHCGAMPGVPALLEFTCICRSPRPTVLVGSEQPWAHTRALGLAFHSGTGCQAQPPKPALSPVCHPSHTGRAGGSSQRLLLCLTPALNFCLMSKQPGETKINKEKMPSEN